MSEELDEKLSSYLDGALDFQEASALERQLSSDAALMARLDGLKRADALARDHFQAVLNQPVPLALARAIEGAGTNRPRTPVLERLPIMERVRTKGTFPLLHAVAAALVLVLAGIAGGYLAGRTATGATEGPSDWLTEIADYHRVYSGQKRHLVEVPASEKDHIETWLTKVVGVPVQVPDLTGEGLTFEGGRLLVADADPVAQLMYTHDDGGVVALCVSAQEAEGAAGFDDLVIGPTRLVSWWEDGSAYVVVGDQADTTLDSIARAAAPLI